MAAILFANNASTTLAGPITNTSTSVNVAAGSGVLFPNPGASQFFKLTFLDAATKSVREIVHVTSVSGDTFTIVRAQEGTTALPWLAGDFAANQLTAGTLALFAQTASLPSSFFVGTDTGGSGTPNAVTVATFTPTNTAPTAGQNFLVVKSGYGNTGPVTLQNGSGAQFSVVFKDGSALSPGDWPASSEALLYFTGGVYQFVACQAALPTQTALVHVGPDTGSVNAIVATVTPTIISYSPGSIYRIKIANTITGATTANINGLGTKAVVRADGSAVRAGDLLAGQEAPLVYDGTNLQVEGLNPTNVVTIVPPGTTTVLYIRTDGNDANNGSANTSAAAFATISAAAIYGTSRFSLAGGALSLQLGNAGTYAPPGPIPTTVGTLNILGDAGNPGNFIISGAGPSAGSSALIFPLGGSVQVNGLTLQNTGTINHTVNTQGSISFQNTIFTATAGAAGTPYAHIQSAYGGQVTIQSGCTFAASMAYLAVANSGSVAFVSNVAIANSPTFSGATVASQSTGILTLFPGVSFTGTGATGQRYLVGLNGVISVFGAGANAFPGSTAGTASAGGQYA